MKNPHPPLTWGQVKAWAEANKIPDDAVIHTDAPYGDYRIRDLSSWEGDPGEWVFILQHKWG